jgi:hypothetical protein
MKILPIRYLVVVLALIYFGQECTMAQTDMTKDEILVAWKSMQKKGDILSVKDFRALDYVKNTRVNEAIGRLLSDGIDSFIIYTESYPGYLSSNRCYVGQVIDSYIIWRSDTSMHIKLIKGTCESEFVNFNSLEIFTYCKQNVDVMEKEVVMPVIFGGQRKTDSIYSFSTQSISHEPNYSIAIAFGNTFKLTNFAESDLLNKENIFHEYNFELRSIRLWELIKNYTTIR